MRHEKKPFGEAFKDFLFSGSMWRTFAIGLIVMAAVVGTIFILADTFG